MTALGGKADISEGGDRTAVLDWGGGAMLVI
jgi:hypothetical protein